MTYYTLHHKNGSKQTLFCSSKEALINEAFKGNQQLFKKSVQFLQWTNEGICITENIVTGSVQRSVGGADVNPYGWRG